MPDSIRDPSPDDGGGTLGDLGLRPEARQHPLERAQGADHVPALPAKPLVLVEAPSLSRGKLTVDVEGNAPSRPPVVASGVEAAPGRNPHRQSDPFWLDAVRRRPTSNAGARAAKRDRIFGGERVE